MKCFDYLDTLCDSLGINMEEKGILLSSLDKDKADARSNGVCPRCQASLTPETTHYDHVLCKSKHASTYAVCICDTCNLRKSDWTSEELKNYADYIEKQNP